MTDRLEPVEAVEASQWFARHCSVAPNVDEPDALSIHDVAEDQQYLLGQAVAKFVTGSAESLPTTFAFDQERLAELRRDSQVARQRVSKLQATSSMASGVTKSVGLHGRPCNELYDMVKDEMKAIASATPLQIHEYYTPTWYAQSTEPNPSPRNIAQRIAHISVVHWRVWAPILYRRTQVPPDTQPAPQSSLPYALGILQSEWRTSTPEKVRV